MEYVQKFKIDLGYPNRLLFALILAKTQALRQYFMTNTLNIDY
jgi:hypothetical protein